MRLALSAPPLLAVPSAFGQASAINGQIVGVITDPAGAAVANAKIKAINLATGFTRLGGEFGQRHLSLQRAAARHV
jgi:hypothetical protein